MQPLKQRLLRGAVALSNAVLRDAIGNALFALEDINTEFGKLVAGEAIEPSLGDQMRSAVTDLLQTIISHDLAAPIPTQLQRFE